ncbi:hypothetical protein ASG93_14180 [Paenibacillus sp. Soil787]|nr:hypothetical protein ASG93_14180 [Paenibacillus sp. Soil787]
MIDASPEQVWDAVSDVGAVHYRLVPGYTENTLMDGHERTFILPNGGMVRHLTTKIQARVKRGAEVMKKTIEAETKGGD